MLVGKPSLSIMLVTHESWLRKWVSSVQVWNPNCLEAWCRPHALVVKY